MKLFTIKNILNSGELLNSKVVLCLQSESQIRKLLYFYLALRTLYTIKEQTQTE